MKTILPSHEIPRQAEIETALTNLNNELIETLTHQAKQDAQKSKEVTKTDLKVKVTDYVRAKVLTITDFINQIRDMDPNGGNVVAITTVLTKTIEENTITIEDASHEEVAVKNKRNAIPLDPFKTRFWVVFLIIAVLLGIADGVISYGSFRFIYSFWQALIVTAALAGVISGTHFLYAGWIQNTKALWLRSIKIFLILGVALFFFYWISIMRVEAMHSAVDLSVANSGAPAYVVSHHTRLGICIISFLLFTAVFFFSLKFHKSKEEQINEREARKLDKQLKQLRKKIIVTTKENKTIQTQVAVQTTQSSNATRYYDNAIKRAQNIGEHAISYYMNVYAQFHGSVPKCFENITPRAYLN